MFRSIIDDIKGTFSYGNMVSKLLAVNAMIFIVLILLEAFTKNLGWFDAIYRFMALPSQPLELLFKPWTLITHMFSHLQFWHIVWNMVGLYIFGRIVGDLIGDKKVLPIYLLGGLAGAVFFIASALLADNVTAGSALGASASVMALAMVGGMIAPDYAIRLILLGNVKLKFIVLFFLIFDLVGARGFVNSGGHFAHLGGMAMGACFVFLLQRGTDLSVSVNRLLDFLLLRRDVSGKTKKHRSVMRVEHRAEHAGKKQSYTPGPMEDNFESRLDEILDKIKQKGYNTLTNEEKDFLDKASQK